LDRTCFCCVRNLPGEPAHAGCKGMSCHLLFS
jgi:hypothetical protein